MPARFNDYPIIFTHVPRSAGTTLVHIMRKQYRKDEQFFFYVRQKAGNTDEALAEFARLPEQRRNRLKLLQGHTSYGVHQGYDTYTYITLLRDPVERVISYYYYILKRPEHYLHSVLLSNRMHLEDFVASNLSTELDNIQTRQISGIRDVPYGKCTESMLDAAEQHLMRHYRVFGITEMFDESVILMKRQLGWSYPFYTRQNVIKNRPLKDQVSASAVELIERTNALDVRLYQFARRRFAERLAQQDDSFHKELERFRRYNALIQKVSSPSTGNFGFTLWDFYLTLRPR